MFTFLHAADIHLDSPLNKLDAYEGAPVDAFRQATRRAFENLIQLAISEDVAFVVISGDLYDGDWRDYNTGLYLVSQMTRLRDAGIPVFVVAGNHDAASKITKNLRLPDNVTLFPSDKPATVRLDQWDVALHGQSYATPAVKADLSQGYPEALPGVFNVGILHTCATGREGHEPYAPCSLDNLLAKGYDYWALGHVHRYELLSEDPPVVFPGNLQGRHIRETGPKGCVLVRMDDTQQLKMAFRPLDVVRWSQVEIDAAGAASGYDIMDRIRRQLETLLAEHDGMPLGLRIGIRGETDAHNEMLADFPHWMNEIRSAALDAGSGRIWVEKVRLDTRPAFSRQGLRQSEGAMGELLRLFDDLRDDPQLCAMLQTELADLENKIPRELKSGSEGFRFDDPAWMADLLAQVQPLLVKRLLKKGDGE